MKRSLYYISSVKLENKCVTMDKEQAVEDKKNIRTKKRQERNRIETDDSDEKGGKTTRESSEMKQRKRS